MGVDIKGRGIRALGAGVAVAALWVSFTAVSAEAQLPELLFQAPAESQTGGSGAGQFANPRGVAADGASGHVFVADLNNARIDEIGPWGQFVKAWGWDVAPEGAPGDTPSDGLEVCVAQCKAGTVGFGPGQVGAPWGITVDEAGGVYVYEAPLGGGSFRLQKFSADGGFLWMVGGGVNQGPNNPGNICTAQHLAEGDTCGSGAPGSGQREFSDTSVRDYVTYNPVTGTIFVGDRDRIQELDTSGAFLGEIAFEAPEHAAFDGENVHALAADPVSGDLYAAFPLGNENIYRLDETSGAVLDTLELDIPRLLAVNMEGTVYAVRGEPFFSDLGGGEVVAFNAAGGPVEGMEPGDGFGAGDRLNGLTADGGCPVSGDPGQLIVTYFEPPRSYLRAFGPPAPCEDPPTEPPAIEVQYASTVGVEEAALQADINPRFWSDATYYVEYGLGKCTEGGCSSQRPAPPGASLTKRQTNSPVRTAAVILQGLEPGTTYHYRFVAQSSGGGPVLGEGGGAELDPGEFALEGTESTFETYRRPQAPARCANDSLRLGAAAAMPDCRAYEMVSPLAKNNNDLVAQYAVSGYLASLNRSSSSGKEITYSAPGAFGGATSAQFVSQYMAHREVDGWRSESLSPPRSRSVIDPPVDNEFEAFSSDLCWALLQTYFEPKLAESAVAGHRNLYRRDNCGDSGYEALSTVEPTQAPAAYKMRPQGISADGSTTVFVANENLAGTAAPANEDQRMQLYRHDTEGGPSFICILPSGTPTAQACSAGTSDEALRDGPNARAASLQGAISRDGSRVFWTESTDATGGPGRIYLRVAGEAQSRTVSQAVSGAAARFWGASSDGARVVFSFQDSSSPQDGRLYVLDVGSGTPTLIASGVIGVLGLSEDAKRIYFASENAIVGSGQNSEEDKAEPGEANVYMWDQAAGSSFVATLSEEDTKPGLYNPFTHLPYLRTARVTPSGKHLAFMSAASLTGYDSTVPASSEPAQEVFLYDAEQQQLRCASCNPTGARPTAAFRDDLEQISGDFEQWLAARIPGHERPLHASRVLSEDGTRLFFESFDTLVPRDTNGVADVYQWEELGVGTCNSQRPNFVSDSGGCVDLISSGRSPRRAEFIDADTTGDNIFFSTLASLVPPDYGLVDVYVARVRGGFEYTSPSSPCEGDACQSPPSPPSIPVPSSSTFRDKTGVARLAACRRQASRARRLAARARRTRRAARRVRSLRQSRVLRRKMRRLARRAGRASGAAKRCRAHVRRGKSRAGEGQ